VQPVLDVVHRVGHVVRPVHDLRLEAGAGAGGGLADPVEHRTVVLVHAELHGRQVGGVGAARPGVLGGGVEGGAGEVEADGALGGEPLGLDAGEQSEGLGVALEAAAVVGELVQGLFAVVAERRVAEVVGEAGRFDQVGVAAEGGAQLTADLGALQGVGQAGPGTGVPGLDGGPPARTKLRVGEGPRCDHLGLAGQAAQGRGVQDAGAVALEGGAARSFVGFGCPAFDRRRVVGREGCGAGTCGAFHGSTVRRGGDNRGVPDA